jgi:hypothetical protein
MCFETFCTHVLIHCIHVQNLEYLFFVTQLYYSCTDFGVLVSSYGMMTMCKQVSKVRRVQNLPQATEFRSCVGQRVKLTLSQVHHVGWKVGGQETLFPVQSSSRTKQTWVVSSIVVLSVQSHKSLVKFISQISNAIH